MERSAALVMADLRPVRRLPSDAALLGVAMLVFVAFSLIVALGLGVKGFEQLSGVQRLLYYGTVLGCGVLLAIGIIPQMVPGAMRRIRTATAVGVSLAAMSVCATLVFPQGDLNRFVALGWPCLRSGLLCAAGSGAIAYLLLRRGYLVTPLQTAVLSAVLAGFTGIAMLAIHCPQQNWMHVVVWHLGAPVLSGVAVWMGWQIKIIFERA